MSTLKISNYDQVAPLWWKRLETGVITFLIPSFIGLVMALPIADQKRMWFTAGAGFLGGLFKAVGVLVGESPGEAAETAARAESNKKDQ